MSDARCPAVSSTGLRCSLVEHDTLVHYTLTEGWLQPWMTTTDGWQNRLTVPDDPLADAPLACGGPVRANTVGGAGA